VAVVTEGAQRPVDGPPGRFRVLVHATENAVMLSFEPWGDEYAMGYGARVVVELDDSDGWKPVEMLHTPGGITFFGSGRRPSLWTVDGQPIPWPEPEEPVVPKPGRLRRTLAKLRR
jgi:hypothetical protein